MAYHPARAAAIVVLSALTALTAAGCASPDEDSSTDNRAGTGDRPGAEASAEPSPPGSPAEPSDGSPQDASGGADQEQPSGHNPSQDQDQDQDADDGAPWCAAESLSASLTPLSPGAGNRYAALVLTNTSDTACRTQGWPGLQLVTADGEEIPTTTVRDDSAGARPLTVEPGGSVHTQLHWTVVPSDADPATGCGPEPASLRVIPPDEYGATSAEWELGAVCGDGRIEALPLEAGEGPG
ncbi:DUF4232 domain-containing protein [Streptomyces sp. 6N223]|uniref:DUF4232 domain-containing protein n=1 Tax=Streptomyces sp. 6N223 TaxID=3457412 RepID=UPI003FD2A67F